MIQRLAHRSRVARGGLVGLAMLAAIAGSSHALAGPPENNASADIPGGGPPSVPVLQWLAARGSAAAQRNLGLMYASGQGVGQDSAQAAKWFAMAASQGDVGAKTMLTALCSNGQGPALAPCLPLAADIKAAAARGDPQAQIELGGFYLVGAAGLPRDSATGLAWFHKAADQGYVRAEFQLGRAYSSGLWGVSVDPEQAMNWFRKAADQGDVTSMQTLATAYRNGLHGAAKDPAQAAAWYLKAANAGDLAAQSALASMYADGEGVAADPVQAAYWYRKAAEQGDPNAAAALATAYAGGKGAPRDDVQAYVWMNLAIALTEYRPEGAPDYWISARDLIAKRLTYSQRADARTQLAALRDRLAPHDQAGGERRPGGASGF